MNYTNLGTSGLRVSRICLGMMGFGNDSDRPWVIDEDAAEPIVRAAVEGGVTFFDTADAYSGGASEVATGRLVPKFLSRDEVVIATKVFMPVSPGENGGGLSRKHILSGIDASLKRLKMDYVDLYQIHRWDPRTPIEETMEALHDVVRSGKARYIGASSMSSWQFAKAQYTAEAHGWTKFVSMQNHYNLIYREEEREMIPLCLDQGVGCIPWSPLARGMLAGNRTRDGGRHTTRSSTDAFTDYLYDQPTAAGFRGGRRRGAGRGRPRRPAGAGGAGMGARQAGRDGAHCGLHQEEALEGRPRRGGAAVVRGRDRRTGEALHAPPGPRALLGG
jgi:aryl-alcohol dehydrogenase-like predicted oxidoreductase